MLYGEGTAGSESWSVNIEPLADRCRARGWRIEPHSHPDFAQLAFVRCGRGTMTAEDALLTFESPCAMVVPIRSVHGYSYELDSDGWVITIAEYYLRQIVERLPEFGALWSRLSIIPLRRDGDEAAEIQGTVRKLERELEARAIGHVLAAESQLTSLFLSLVRCTTAGSSRQSPLSSSEGMLVQRFNELIEKRYRQGWKVKEYAEVLGVSASQLQAACACVCGEPPIKLVHLRKLTEAKRNLIFSDMSIEQIAYWLGFSSPAYFARFFKTQVGESPGQYRTAQRSVRQASPRHPFPRE